MTNMSALRERLATSVVKTETESVALPVTKFREIDTAAPGDPAGEIVPYEVVHDQPEETVPIVESVKESIPEEGSAGVAEEDAVAESQPEAVHSEKTNELPTGAVFEEQPMEEAVEEIVGEPEEEELIEHDGITYRKIKATTFCKIQYFGNLHMLDRCSLVPSLYSAAIGGEEARLVGPHSVINVKAEDVITLDFNGMLVIPEDTTAGFLIRGVNGFVADDSIMTDGKVFVSGHFASDTVITSGTPFVVLTGIEQEG